MKRFVIVLALIVFLAGSADATVKFGVKGGINLADLKGDLEDTKMKLGYGAGVWVNLSLAGMFNIQPELYYMTKGVKADIDEDAGIRLSYVEIPVLFKYGLPLEGPISPSFYFGPSFGILMAAEEYVEDADHDIKEHLEELDFGLVFGAGVDIGFGGGFFTFDARYSLGLKNIVTDDGEGEGMELKNAGLQFLAGYGWGF